MAAVPEIVFHRTLVLGFRKLRNDTRIIDTIFRHLDQEQLQSIKDFVQSKSIDFSINYPKASLKIPALVLLLRTEQEDQTFLGNIMGAPPHYDMPDAEYTVDTLDAHAASVSNLAGLPRKIIGDLAVASSTASTLYFSTTESDRLLELLTTETLPLPRVYVTKGTGAGQSFIITRLTNNLLDIDGTFDPQLDSSSVVDIREAQELNTLGEPSRVYESTNTNILRIGANYSAQYQLNILAGSQEEVLYLYNIVKALLLSQTVFLESQGIQALKISGSDLAPRTEFLPTEAFQRVMTLQFTYPFDFIQENESAFSSLSIQLDVPEDGVPITFNIEL